MTDISVKCMLKAESEAQKQREMDTAILQSIRNRVTNKAGTAAVASYLLINDKNI